MDELISDIEQHCAAAGVTPQRLLREAIGAGWGQWDAWKSGASSPTMKVVDRLRAHMAAHPPPASGETRPAEDAA